MTFIESLRELLAWYEEHPETAGFNSTTVAYFRGREKESKELVQGIARNLGTFTKSGTESTYTLVKEFGSIEVRFVFYRDAVCEKRVVKTETYEQSGPDPERMAEIPDVIITKTREVIEWDCPVLLMQGGKA